MYTAEQLFEPFMYSFFPTLFERYTVCVSCVVTHLNGVTEPLYEFNA